MRTPLRHHRRGTTLLEVVAATALTALVIVPSTAMMRDGLELSRRVERQGVMTSLCVGKLEQQLAKSTAAFLPDSDSGSFASDGYDDLRYVVSASDLAVDGGIPDRLMAITATVYYDKNGNGSLDAGETRVNFSTKIANLESYQNEANPS